MAALGAFYVQVMCILFSVSASSAVYLNVVLAVIFYNFVLHCSNEYIVLFLALR